MLKRFGILIFLLAAIVPTMVRAQAWTLDDARADWSDFALGFATSLAAHEAGHYVVAKSKGYEVGHDGLSITYPNAKFRPGDQLQIASAGFQTQWLLDEVALRESESSGRKPTNFGAGMVCAQLGTTLAYLTFLKNHPRGDTAGMSQATGLSNDRLALLLAVPGLLDGWRLLGNDVPKYVPQIAVMGKGLSMVWIWTY